VLLLGIHERLEDELGDGSEAAPNNPGYGRDGCTGWTKRLHHGGEARER